MDYFFMLLGKICLVVIVLALAGPFILSFLAAKEDEASGKLVETSNQLWVSIDPKDKLYNYINSIIEKASGKEDILKIEQLLLDFKKRFGKCEHYCNLYGDYYRFLMTYSESQTS